MNPSTPVVRATADGSPTLFSPRFNASYHSLFGAIEESLHVFISAGLYYKYRHGQRHLSIFEMGLGTGLNALLSAIVAADLDMRIAYTAVEQYPIASKLYERLMYADELKRSDWHETFLSIHRSPWHEACQITPFFALHKQQMDVRQMDTNPVFDVIFYDAFAPSVQGELWTTTAMERMYGMLAPNGILVTYCAKGSFKRNLKHVGFRIECLRGPAKKREMIRAHR